MKLSCGSKVRSIVFSSLWPKLSAFLILNTRSLHMCMCVCGLPTGNSATALRREKCHCAHLHNTMYGCVCVCLKTQCFFPNGDYAKYFLNVKCYAYIYLCINCVYLYGHLLWRLWLPGRNKCTKWTKQIIHSFWPQYSDPHSHNDISTSVFQKHKTLVMVSVCLHDITITDWPWLETKQQKKTNLSVSVSIHLFVHPPKCIFSNRICDSF